MTMALMRTGLKTSARENPASKATCAGSKHSAHTATCHQVREHRRTPRSGMADLCWQPHQTLRAAEGPGKQRSTTGTLVRVRRTLGRTAVTQLCALKAFPAVIVQARRSP